LSTAGTLQSTLPARGATHHGDRINATRRRSIEWRRIGLAEAAPPLTHLDDL
jgi:hypothetical protein